MFCWARKPLPVLPPAWGHGTLQAQEAQGVQEVQEVQEVYEVSSPTLGVPPLDLLKELLAELLPPNSIPALWIYRGDEEDIERPNI